VKAPVRFDNQFYHSLGHISTKNDIIIERLSFSRSTGVWGVPIKQISTEAPQGRTGKYGSVNILPMLAKKEINPCKKTR